MTPLDATDPRMRPLYRAAEAARLVGVHPTTFRNWAYGYERRFTNRPDVHQPPVVTAVKGGHGLAVPFVGLAEGMVLAAFRQAGLPLQRVRRAVTVLAEELGLEHVLASRSLYTDGANVLYDFAEHYDDEDLGGLVIVEGGQRVFRPIIDRYLKRITFSAGDGLAERLILPTTAEPILEVDPTSGFGQPRFIHGGAPLASVKARVEAGESLDEVARDYELDRHELEQALRIADPVAA